MLKHSVWQDLMIEQDKFGRCAIHVAAINGRWDIIEKFISIRPDCVQIRSSDHKSVLHFAVECNPYEVVKLLLKDKSDSKIAEMVSRDHDNLQNTALHMATKNRVDLQLLDLLLSSPVVDVNARNIDGMTALDIASAGSQNNSHCPTIEWKLKCAGSMKCTRAMHARGEPNTIPDDIVNTCMVVASLIAIVTFAAVFQIPGGIEEDDKTKAQYGAAKLALHKLFRLFVFSDTAAFITSLSVVVICLIKRRWQETHLGSLVPHALSNISAVNLIISIFWTVVAFVTATILITVPRDLDKLKHHEAFTKYQSLWQNEIWLVVAIPYLVVLIFLIVGPPFAAEKRTLRGNLERLLHWVKRTLRMPNLCKNAVKLYRDLGIFKIFLCQLSIMTAFILIMSFV
ncbi:protein ACCELERATED CELL DEATH 6 [Cryptomeria japonica]|uniref:protein ACCELERATED CELL DEATH 6 n=1 Tax=Cryptomeria japonica TaxID=3369 RepID=UPI0027DA8907|nr:protein ACCELERATED CELL DEATH 6 [Cryptomeria japonica]